jgi:putative addiction module CopG family antidote
MANARRLEIMLPEDMAELVEAKVASGEYPTSSAVIVEGLHILRDRETTLENWLRTEVVAAYDEVDADPDSLISGDELRRELADWHRQVTNRK